MRVAIAQYEGPSTLRVLPLAAGLLAATVRKAPDLADLVPSIHHRRDDPDEAAAALIDVDVLGLSLYTWNERYALEVARRVKARSPATLIVAGGPSVPRRPDDVAAWLAEHGAIDVLVHGEGERVFVEIVRARRAGRALVGLVGTSVRTATGHEQTPRGPRLSGDDFLAIGSPYLDGTFDDLLSGPRAPQVGAAVFETNRGCPFACTFCDWGQATESRVNELPLERVLGEIRWAAERQIPYVYFVDANFGIRRRDIDIVRAVGAIAAETGFPKYVYFHLTKNATAKNLATVMALREAGVGTSVALSMQDFDDTVLAAIKRDNIHPDRALELRARCHAEGLPTTNELMLGLPAQTAAGFRASLVRALTPYPDDSFFLYATRVLINAELADPAYRARFGLVTREVPTLPRDPTEPIHVVERELVVVGSDAMPLAAWRDTFAFGYLFAALVNQRLLATTLRLIGFVLRVDLTVAVDALLTAMAPRLVAVVEALRKFADAILAGVGTTLPLDGLGPTRREPVEAACAEALADWPAFLAEVSAVLTGLVAEDDAVLLREAIAWDALHIPEHRAAADTRTFTHDWWSWSAADARPPTPARLPAGLIVTRHVPAWSHGERAAWFDAFISLGWSKTARVVLSRVD